MLRWIRGVVTLEAEGGYPEELLNRAAEQGVELWDTRRRGVSLIARCRAGDYRRLRRPARRSGMRMRVRSRHGLPFLLRPLHARWGLAVGAVAAFIALQLLSGRVWVITVNGNATLPDEQILRVLEPLGVYVGAAFDEVDVPGTQLAALQQLPQVGWLSINASGSVVEVLVSEREPSLPIEDTAPANVVAACDGVIVEMEVTGGQAAVQVGDAVTKGTLLISGVTDSQVGPLLKRASGSVTARVTVTLTARVPLEEPVKQAGERICRPTLTLFGLRIPLYTSGSIDKEYTESNYERLLRAGDKTLPLGWTVTEWTVWEDGTVRRTAAEALAEAHRRLAEQEAALTDVTVEEKRIDERQDGTAAVVTGTYTVLREIGVVQEIALGR